MVGRKGEGWWIGRGRGGWEEGGGVVGRKGEGWLGGRGRGGG